MVFRFSSSLKPLSMAASSPSTSRHNRYSYHPSLEPKRTYANTNSNKFNIDYQFPFGVFCIYQFFPYCIPTHLRIWWVVGKRVICELKSPIGLPTHFIRVLKGLRIDGNHLETLSKMKFVQTPNSQCNMDNTFGQ